MREAPLERAEVVMGPTAIIGGTGLDHMDSLVVARREAVSTPFGSPSAPLIHGTLDGAPVVFLARHGEGHTVPPHKLNFRANIWALKNVGVGRVIAVAAVGGIATDAGPRRIVIPHQVIDYTYGRSQTFFEDPGTRSPTSTSPTRTARNSARH